jgi:hypothetical protein
MSNPDLFPELQTPISVYLHLLLESKGYSSFNLFISEHLIFPLNFSFPQPKSAHKDIT